VNKQPLSYQQQDSSCWITSILNGLIYSLGSADKIPNEIARILYVLSSKDGTYNAEAEKIVKYLNLSELKVKLRVWEGSSVTPQKVKSILKKKGVIIADIDQGGHSVLITNYADKQFKIFDPDWNTIRKGMKTNISGTTFTTSEYNYNISIDEKELFKNYYKGKIRLGGEKSRLIIEMANA
jgi:hypothetical protein